VTQHSPTSSHDILEQVPPEYYDVGMQRNRFQRLWHGRKWAMLRELATKDRAFTPAEVLDVGCAGGLTTSQIASWFPNARVTGLDAFDEAVLYARKQRAGVNFVLGDGHELPLASERFDLVTCAETLEHLGDPRRAVTEMRRCLRPGGIAIVAQDTDSLLFRTVWWVWTKSRGEVWEHAHVNPLNAKALKGLLQEVGFRVLETRYTFFGMEVFYKAQRTD